MGASRHFMETDFFPNARPMPWEDSLPVPPKNAGCWPIPRMKLKHGLRNREIPCVLAGTRHPSVDLPDVDFDAHALCFHAANTALSLGHRRIALLLTESPGFVASEVAAESGFREAFVQRNLPGAVPLVAWHQRSRDHLVRVLERLFCRRGPTNRASRHPWDGLSDCDRRPCPARAPHPGPGVRDFSE